MASTSSGETSEEHLQEGGNVLAAVLAVYLNRRCSVEVTASYHSMPLGESPRSEEVSQSHERRDEYSYDVWRLVGELMRRHHWGILHCVHRGRYHHWIRYSIQLIRQDSWTSRLALLRVEGHVIDVVSWNLRYRLVLLEIDLSSRCGQL